VLWEHGEFSYYPARLGARLVAAYVEKQRRLQNNLMPVKAPNPKPVEVGAVWTAPNPSAGVQGEPPTKMQAGKFYVGAKGAVTGTSEGNSTTALKAAPSVPAAPKNATRSSIRNPIAASSSANVKSGKPAQGPSESARLSSQPALPGKSTQVKSQ